MTENSPIAKGTIIASRYVIEELVGEGGMGQVFRAEDKQLGRKVAVKISVPKQNARPDADKRFRREARIGAQLSHPNRA